MTAMEDFIRAIEDADDDLLKDVFALNPTLADRLRGKLEQQQPSTKMIKTTVLIDCPIDTDGDGDCHLCSKPSWSWPKGKHPFQVEHPGDLALVPVEAVSVLYGFSHIAHHMAPLSSDVISVAQKMEKVEHDANRYLFDPNIDQIQDAIARKLPVYRRNLLKLDDGTEWHPAPERFARDFTNGMSQGREYKIEIEKKET